MTGPLTRFLPWLRRASNTNSADDVLRPNQVLDAAMPVAMLQSPDNLVWQDGHLLFTSGRKVLLLDGTHDRPGEPEEILRFEHGITAMAAAQDGSLAVGLGVAGIVIIGGAYEGKSITSLGGKPLIAPSALAFVDPDTLIVCVGSENHPPGNWERGLGRREGQGSVWRVRLARSDAVCLASNLAFPSGVLIHGRSRIVVSEAGRRRIVELPAAIQGATRALLDDLPGYPGRLAVGSDESVWLAVFAARGSAAEPAHSYGLAVRLDHDFKPIASFYGSAAGHRRGVTSCLEMRGELFVTCRDDNILVSVDLGHGS